MSFVIQRNTPIPTEEARIYVTSVDYQYSMVIMVFQGERSRSTDNHLLGKFNISGIPPAPRGVPEIRVCFKIDVNGILTVSAKILSTGRMEKLIITIENGRISKEEIEKMVKDAKKYEREDREYKKKTDAYNALEDFLYDMIDKFKVLIINQRVHRESLENMKNAIMFTTKWLKDNRGAPVHQVQSMKEFLESACM